MRRIWGVGSPKDHSATNGACWHPQHGSCMTTKNKEDSRSAHTQVDSAGQESALQGKGASSKNVRESDELKTYRTQFKTVLMILHFLKKILCF